MPSVPVIVMVLCVRDGGVKADARVCLIRMFQPLLSRDLELNHDNKGTSAVEYLRSILCQANRN
ncbi:hypothetical protein PABG_11802 [Paracoccidioides brasiliensis Pb03]|nr:hypothetical protein PABG_11802 [Paracoccidioides brasiliensis Pb03]